MPYIKQANRDELDNAIEELLTHIAPKTDPSCDGELNYVISRIVAHVLGAASKGWSYVDIVRVVGTFECAKLEFYRRIAARKEDRAIETNGDIQEYEQ